MTKGDIYLKDVEKFILDYVCYLNKNELDYNAGTLGMFLKQQVKPTLSEDEKVILRNIAFKDYNYIGRNTSGDLYVHYEKNDSFNGTWFIMFKKNLFQFIQSGEEYNIKYLLGDE